jgi:arylsulfatase A-like enzyme
MRLNFGKTHHYEFDTRVPMMLRGPLIGANTTSTFLAGNVDVAPTFVELAGWTDGAGGRRPPRMDGRSMVSQLLGSDGAGGGARAEAPPWPRSMFLNEYVGLAGWSSSKRINDNPNNT